MVCYSRRLSLVCLTQSVGITAVDVDDGSD